MTELKELALAFLKDCAAGRAAGAFKDYAAPGAKHHNFYFKGDAASLARGMTDNARTFPHKEFQPLRVLQDGALVAVHSRVTLQAGMTIAAVHLLRFEDDKIAELWDVAAQVPDDSPNENGAF